MIRGSDHPYRQLLIPLIRSSAKLSETKVTSEGFVSADCDRRAGYGCRIKMEEIVSNICGNMCACWETGSSTRLPAKGCSMDGRFDRGLSQLCHTSLPTFRRDTRSQPVGNKTWQQDSQNNVCKVSTLFVLVSASRLIFLVELSCGFL